jgi:hypothetical protein
MRSEDALLVGGAAHRLEDGGAGVLEGDVEVGEDAALRHEGDDLVDVGVGVDVVEADPGAEGAQLAAEVEEAGADLAAVPVAGGVAEVDAVGAGVLGDDQELLGAGGDQGLGLAEHVGGGAGGQVAADLGDDAEGAAVVAAFGNLQVGVMLRG